VNIHKKLRILALTALIVCLPSVAYANQWIWQKLRLDSQITIVAATNERLGVSWSFWCASSMVVPLAVTYRGPETGPAEFRMYLPAVPEQLRERLSKVARFLPPGALESYCKK